MNEDNVIRQLSRAALISLENNEYFKNTQCYDSTKIISMLNNFSLYFFFTVCTISNVFLIISFQLRTNKELHKYHQPFYCFSNQLNIVFFALANFKFYDQLTSFIHYSKYSCKILTFLIHVTSTLSNWILAYGIFILKCQVRKKKDVLERNQPFLFFLPIVLVVVYSGDLYFLDLQTINFKNISNIENHYGYVEFCGLNKFYLILLRDLIDFFAFSFIPLLFILYNICFLKTPDKIIPKLKLLIPLIYSVCCVPICVILLFRDYQIKFERTFFYLVELSFTIFVILNQTLALIVLFIHVLLSEHSRILFKRFVCFKCMKCRLVTIEIRRNSSNDVLNLKELQKLNLNNLTYK